MKVRSIAVLLIALILGGCASASDSTGGKQSTKTDVTVFAASSLTEAFTKLGSVFERRDPGSSVRFNFAASDTLATQITQGGPADVFAAASADPMATVTAAKVAGGHPTVFASNRLVIIASKDSGTHITSPHDLATSGVKLVLAAPGVPAGDYAREVLDNLGIRGPAMSNLVSNEVDDKSVVSKVLLGNAEAGIVYITDLTPDVASKLQVIHIPKADNVIARYPIVALKQGAEPAAGRRFVDLVLSPKGERILRAFGFGPP